MYKLPERGGGGGEVIRAMPERKHSFFQEVFPNREVSYLWQDPIHVFNTDQPLGSSYSSTSFKRSIFVQNSSSVFCQKGFLGEDTKFSTCLLAAPWVAPWVSPWVLSSKNTKTLHICYQIQRKTGAESIQQIWKENLSTNWKLFFSWKTGLEKNLAKNCLVLIPGWERYEGAFSPVPEKYGWANGNYFEAQRGRWVLLFYLKLSPRIKYQHLSDPFGWPISSQKLDQWIFGTNFVSM